MTYATRPRPCSFVSIKMYAMHLLGVGFEPTPPERIDLKSTALDHSATQARLFVLLYLLYA
jgi:hypothetical protein